MALKVKSANRPIYDAEGFIVASLESVLMLDAEDSEFDSEQFLFNFVAEGLRKSINFKLWTGTKINPDKYSTEDSKDKKYNKLTQLCLNLNVLNTSDLEALAEGKELDIDLEKLEGMQVKFKLNKAKGFNLGNIDLFSIQPLEAAKPTSKQAKQASQAEAKAS